MWVSIRDRIVKERIGTRLSFERRGLDLSENRAILPTEILLLNRNVGHLSKLGQKEINIVESGRDFGCSNACVHAHAPRKRKSLGTQPFEPEVRDDRDRERREPSESFQTPSVNHRLHRMNDLARTPADAPSESLGSRSCADGSLK